MKQATTTRGSAGWRAAKPASTARPGSFTGSEGVGNGGNESRIVAFYREPGGDVARLSRRSSAPGPLYPFSSGPISFIHQASGTHSRSAVNVA